MASKKKIPLQACRPERSEGYEATMFIDLALAPTGIGRSFGLTSAFVATTILLQNEEKQMLLLVLFYFHRLPHSPRSFLWVQAWSGVKVPSPLPIDVASNLFTSTFTSVTRGAVYIFFIYYRFRVIYQEQCITLLSLFSR